MDMNTKQKTVKRRSSNFQPRIQPGKTELGLPKKPAAKTGKNI